MDPIVPQRKIHQTVDPRKTPATNSAADRNAVLLITMPNPGRTTRKKTSVRGFAMAIATMDR
jgi:hypothetical protein